MNTNSKPHERKQFVWPVAGIVIAALAGTNTFYHPHITLKIGYAAWLADMVLILMLSTNPITARVGGLVAGLFFSVPCFLWASPLSRGLLMGCMAIPFAIVTLPLLVSPPITTWRERLACFFTWLGTREVKKCVSRFDRASLLHFIAATVVFAATMASVKAVSSSGLNLLVRWLSGGIMILAWAEMVTACHVFVTALVGVKAPAWMQSPQLSASIGEFWTKRWNPATSMLLFRKFFFAPLVGHSFAFAVFAAFFASAVIHALLFYMAIGRWGVSLMCGAFFLVQPLLIAAERWLKVRRWRLAAGRAWTLALLTITSPLFVEPALQIVGTNWGPPGSVLLPTVAVVECVVIVTIFSSLASLASCPEFAQTDEHK